jgi:hypothetical protein
MEKGIQVMTIPGWLEDRGVGVILTWSRVGSCCIGVFQSCDYVA